MSTSNFRKTVQQFIQLLEDEEHQLENKASNNEIAERGDRSKDRISMIQNQKDSF